MGTKICSIQFTIEINKKVLQITIHKNEKGEIDYSIKEPFAQHIYGEDRSKCMGENKVLVYTCKLKKRRKDEKLKEIIMLHAQRFFNFNQN